MPSTTKQEAARLAAGFARNARATREHLQTNKEYFDQHPDERARLEADAKADEQRADAWRKGA